MPHVPACELRLTRGGDGSQQLTSTCPIEADGGGTYGRRRALSQRDDGVALGEGMTRIQYDSLQAEVHELRRLVEQVAAAHE